MEPLDRSTPCSEEMGLGTSPTAPEGWPLPEARGEQATRPTSAGTQVPATQTHTSSEVLSLGHIPTGDRQGAGRCPSPRLPPHSQFTHMGHSHYCSRLFDGQPATATAVPSSRVSRSRAHLKPSSRPYFRAGAGPLSWPFTCLSLPGHTSAPPTWLWRQVGSFWKAPHAYLPILPAHPQWSVVLWASRAHLPLSTLPPPLDAVEKGWTWGPSTLQRPCVLAPGAGPLPSGRGVVCGLWWG